MNPLVFSIGCVSPIGIGLCQLCPTGICVAVGVGCGSVGVAVGSGIGVLVGGTGGVGAGSGVLVGGAGVGSGIGVLVGGTGVGSGTGVLVGGTGVGSGIGVLVGGTGVGSGIGVLVGGAGVGSGIGVLVGGTGVGSGIGVLVGGAGMLVGGCVAAGSSPPHAKRIMVKAATIVRIRGFTANPPSTGNKLSPINIQQPKRAMVSNKCHRVSLISTSSYMPMLHACARLASVLHSGRPSEPQPRSGVHKPPVIRPQQGEIGHSDGRKEMHIHVVNALAH